PLTMHTLLILLIPIPHPPRPTLFPYTTLFRSDTEAVENTEVNGAYASSELDSGAQMEPSAPNDAPDVNVAVAMYARPPCWITNPDRKSTRLNSSHLVISYAVFCLKKKKNSHEDAVHCTSLHHQQCHRLPNRRLQGYLRVLPQPESIHHNAPGQSALRSVPLDSYIT